VMCSDGFPNEITGLTRAAAAAALTNCAKLRREIEIVFISIIDKTIWHQMRDRIARSLASSVSARVSRVWGARPRNRELSKIRSAPLNYGYQRKVVSARRRTRHARRVRCPNRACSRGLNVAFRFEDDPWVTEAPKASPSTEAIFSERVAGHDQP